MKKSGKCIVAHSSDSYLLIVVLFAQLTQTDVILLCYSVDDPTSFHNVLRKWLPELKRHCRGAPKILLGNTKFIMRE